MSNSFNSTYAFLLNAWNQGLTTYSSNFVFWVRYLGQTMVYQKNYIRYPQNSCKKVFEGSVRRASIQAKKKTETRDFWSQTHCKIVRREIHLSVKFLLEKVIMRTCCYAYFFHINVWLVSLISATLNHLFQMSFVVRLVNQWKQCIWYRICNACGLQTQTSSVYRVTP